MSPIWKVILKIRCLFQLPTVSKGDSQNSHWGLLTQSPCSSLLHRHLAVLNPNIEVPWIPRRMLCSLLSGEHCRSAMWAESWGSRGETRQTRLQRPSRRRAKAWRHGRAGRWGTFGVGTEEVGGTRWRQACMLHWEVWICLTSDDVFWSFWTFGFQKETTW